MEWGVSSVGSEVYQGLGNEVYQGLWNVVYPVWEVRCTKDYGIMCIQCGK